MPFEQNPEGLKKNARNVFDFIIIFVSVLKIGGHYLQKTDYCYSIMFSTNEEMQPSVLSPVPEEAGNSKKKLSSFFHLLYFSFCLP